MGLRETISDLSPHHNFFKSAAKVRAEEIARLRETGAKISDEELERLTTHDIADLADYMNQVIKE